MSRNKQIEVVCDYIRSHADERLTLGVLAAKAGLSSFHFQKTFKAIVGVTPRQFVESCRMQRLKGHLRSRMPVTDAVYEAGFGSSSRVYEHSDARLGMTPAQYGAGGQGVSISYAAVESPLGRMMVAATDRGLCFIQFAGTDEDLLELLRHEYPAAALERMNTPYRGEFREWMSCLRNYLRGGEPRLDLPVDVRATAFQIKVWDYLRSIPAGRTESYKDVANGIGQPKAVRAVARACAANRVALVIPCHRVIRGTGDPGDYRWGAERKRKLLEREKQLRSSM